MKSSSAASLLLLMILFSAARGIRSEKWLVGRGEKIHEDEVSAIRSSNAGAGAEVACKDERRWAEAKKPRHWFPGIQEDYYGPRSHRPRHH